MALHSLSLSDRRKFFRPSHTRIYINVKSNLARAISGPPLCPRPIHIVVGKAMKDLQIQHFHSHRFISTSRRKAPQNECTDYIYQLRCTIRSWYPERASTSRRQSYSFRILSTRPKLSKPSSPALVRQQNVSLTTFSPTNVTKPLKRTLKLSGLKRLKFRWWVVILWGSRIISQLSECRVNFREDLEGLKEILEQGWDLHTKVTAHFEYITKRKDSLTNCQWSAYYRFQTTALMSTPSWCYKNYDGASKKQRENAKYWTI